jgi:hypothetical protein
MAEILLDLLENDPHTEVISLDDKDIEDLGEMLPLLAKFPNLKLLSLENNRLVTFPEDLS